MSQEINNLINKVYKEQLTMKDAEIKALQAQINPHFLYNTLETINWKAQLCGANDISEMVTALSSIIDANLDRNNEKMIPVKKELNT
jgi:two-component system sensor histidine kinase YesM